MSTATLAAILMVLFPTATPDSQAQTEPKKAVSIELELHAMPAAKAADKAGMIAGARGAKAQAAPPPSPLQAKLNANGQLEVFHGRPGSESVRKPEQSRD